MTTVAGLVGDDAPLTREQALGIEDYEIMILTGKGKFSEVFKATKGGVVCALKKFSRECMESEGLRRRVEEEIRLLQSLDHPNIVKHRGMFRSSGGEMYIELEWADGGDLKQLLKRHKANQAHFTESRIWNFFVQIVRGVHHMHANRIMHRDLKPANILVMRDLSVKIADLGLSKKMNEYAQEMHSRVGTPLYMAPEVLNNQGYTFSSDVWSMGCILYEMITLNSPFRNTSQGSADDEDDIMGLVTRVTSATYPPISLKLPYSPPLRDLVDAMIIALPADRIECATALAIAEKHNLMSAGSLSPPSALSKNSSLLASQAAGVSANRDSSKSSGSMNATLLPDKTLGSVNVDTSGGEIGASDLSRLRPPALSIPGDPRPSVPSPSSAPGLSLLTSSSPDGTISWRRRYSTEPRTADAGNGPASSPTSATLPPHRPVRSVSIGAPSGGIITGRSGIPQSPRISRLVPVGSAGSLPRSPRSALPTVPSTRSGLASPRSARLPRANTSSPQQQEKKAHKRTVSDLTSGEPFMSPEHASSHLMAVREASNSDVSSPATPGAPSDDEERRSRNEGARSRASLHRLSVATDRASLKTGTNDPKTAPVMRSSSDLANFRLSRLVPTNDTYSPQLPSPFKRKISLTPTASSKISQDLSPGVHHQRSNSNPFGTESALVSSSSRSLYGLSPHANPFSTGAAMALTPKSAGPAFLARSPTAYAAARSGLEDGIREPASGGFPLWENAEMRKRRQSDLGAPSQQDPPTAGGPGLWSPKKLSAIVEESKGDEFPYILGAVIGEGSFARVYRAVNPDTGVSVAVKQMHIEDDDSEAAVQMEKEISFLRTLSHPNLVRYISTQRANAKLNIVLEFCTEGSITSMLRMFKRFPDRLIRLYTKQMVDALIYLHERDIVHRDIKGGNVLVHGEGSRAIVKLSDFGCSKKLGASKNLEKSSRMKGTVLWMAPEAAKQLRDTGTPSDIWSLGATVIEMATGRPPWTDDGLVDEIPALITIATTDRPPAFPRDHLSNSGLEFLRNCMEVKAEKRWSAKQLALHDFLVLEQTATVSTAEVGRKPEVVGASSYNALRAAVKGRDLLQEREQSVKMRMKKAMDHIMQVLLVPSSETVEWRKVFTRDIELSIPCVGVRLLGVPCVYSRETPSGEAKFLGLGETSTALEAALREDGSIVTRFIPTEIKNTRELVQVESRTAMWKWEIRGTFPFAKDQIRVASGSAMATFDVAGQLIKTLEFVWDATGFMEKLAVLSPTGSALTESSQIGAAKVTFENPPSGISAAGAPPEASPIFDDSDNDDLAGSDVSQTTATAPTSGVSFAQPDSQSMANSIAQ